MTQLKEQRTLNTDLLTEQKLRQNKNVFPDELALAYFQIT